MKEQDIQKKILNYLKSEGIYTVKVISASKAGVPDILACIGGKFVGIEVKTPKTSTNVSPLQQYNLEQIHKAGGYSLVAWDLAKVKALLEAIK